jgi:hypothetical protein
LPGGVTRISELEKVFGGKFASVSGRPEIEKILLDAGPGARGIVFGGRGNQPGHVFNAVNQNGAVRFLDGQTGKPATFQGYSEFRLLRTN